MEKTSEQSRIKRNTFISTISLFFQSGYSAALGLLANLILTILLSPKIFGIYITVLSIIAFLNYFSDVGLAGALIQKKELEESDLATTFTVQQSLTLILIIIGFFASDFIKAFYKLPQDGVYLFWALLISFFISSMKTVPSIFLERKIKFQKLVLVQIVENTVFYFTVSILALMGWGLKSFTVAVLLRAIVGFILIYWLSFWMPKIGISITSLKSLLSFGIPFQASSFLALFKDDLIILYLGRALGFEGLGYIGWAKKWAEAPIRIVMDNISRVMFPLLARVQDDTERIKRFCEKILYYQTLLLAPLFVGMLVVMKNFVDIIPHYSKWHVALPLFYIFALSSLLLSFSAPFMNLFNALGKVKLSLFFMTIFTIINWVLTPSLTHIFGFYGFPITHVVVSIAFLLVLLKTKKMFDFQIIKPTYKFVISAGIMGVLLFLIDSLVVQKSLALVVLMLIVGGISYYLSITYLFGFNLKAEIKSFTHPDLS